MKKIAVVVSFLVSLTCLAEPIKVSFFAAYFTSAENSVARAQAAIQKRDVATTCSYLGALADSGKYGVGATMAFIGSNSKPIPGLPANLDVQTIAILVMKTHEVSLRAYNANAFCKVTLGVTETFDGAVKPGNWNDLKIKLAKIETVLKEIASIVQ